MTALSDFWNDMVAKLFEAFGPANEAADWSREDVLSPRRPQSSRRRPDYGLFASGNGSVAMHDGSVCAASVCENRQAQSVCMTNCRNQSFPTQAPSPVPVHESVFIPFKDGSSQIMLRPSLDPQMNLRGASYLISEGYRAREDAFFISDLEDTVDVKVAEYFKAKPDDYLATKFTRIRPGVYSAKTGQGPEMEVEVECVKGNLLLTDGSGHKQPFAKYFEAKPKDTLSISAPPPSGPQYAPQYNGSIFKAQNSLQTIPSECRVSFNDASFVYSRVDAMKVAKEQAALREHAARMTQNGQVPPMERLGKRYDQSMDKKLGPRERRHTQLSMGVTTPRSISIPIMKAAGYPLPHRQSPRVYGSGGC